MSTYTELKSRIETMRRDIAMLEEDGSTATTQREIMARYEAELASLEAEPVCGRQRSLTARPKAGAAASNQYGTFEVTYATAKQTAYIKRLMDSRDMAQADPDKLDVAALREQVDAVQVNKKAASAIIDYLLSLPETVASMTGGDLGAPATDKQRAFIRQLLAERAGNQAAETVRGLLNEARTQFKLTASLASSAIDSLLEIKVALDKVAPKVPNGRYALPAEDGHYVFYKVATPTEGKWAGRTFTTQLVGSVGHWSEQRLSKQVATSVITRIADDVEEAARMFGIKAKACGYCCSPLSNVQSRAAGYGEKCAAANGHYYPTEAEAKDILAERGED